MLKRHLAVKGLTIKQLGERLGVKPARASQILRKCDPARRRILREEFDVPEALLPDISGDPGTKRGELAKLRRENAWLRDRIAKLEARA